LLASGCGGFGSLHGVLVDLLVKKKEIFLSRHFHFFLLLIMTLMLHSYFSSAESTIGISEVAVSRDILTPPHCYKSNICVE